MIIMAGCSEPSDNFSIATSPSPSPTLSPEQKETKYKEAVDGFIAWNVRNETWDVMDSSESLGIYPDQYTVDIQDCYVGKYVIFYADEWDLTRRDGKYYLVTTYPDYYELFIFGDYLDLLRKFKPCSGYGVIIAAQIKTIDRYEFGLYESDSGGYYNIENGDTFSQLIIKGNCWAIEIYDYENATPLSFYLDERGG
jgi:hypothetical protein